MNWASDCHVTGKPGSIFQTEFLSFKLDDKKCLILMLGQIYFAMYYSFTNLFGSPALVGELNKKHVINSVFFRSLKI